MLFTGLLFIVFRRRAASEICRIDMWIHISSESPEIANRCGSFPLTIPVEVAKDGSVMPLGFACLVVIFNFLNRIDILGFKRQSNFGEFD